MITYPNLYHLKYFVDAVELGSISGSAQKNLVSHPAISRAILSLETHLGIELLEHQKKAFKPTKAGHQFAEQAQILLLAASEFGKLNLPQPKDLPIVLKMGISRTLSDLYLGELLKSTKNEFPSSSVQVRFGTTIEIIESVANRTLDIGFTIGNQNLATLKQTSAGKGRFLLVQASKTPHERESFETKSFIITEPRPETEKLKAGYKKEFGRDLPVLFEISSWESIGQLVQKGLGVGLLPEISIKNWKKGSYQVLKPNWFESPYEVYVHTSKAQPPNKVLEFMKNAFFDYVYPKQ
jgi:DNA-binding transcriptional LysR family regulator